MKPLSCCHDCGCVEGELHNYFPECDMERCPLCKGQLLSCDCDKSKITKEIREPYLVKTWCCARCGKNNPNMMMVSDEDWKKVCGGTYKDKDSLCIDCMEFIIKVKKLEIEERRKI